MNNQSRPPSDHAPDLQRNPNLRSARSAGSAQSRTADSAGLPATHAAEVTASRGGTGRRVEGQGDVSSNQQTHRDDEPVHVTRVEALESGDGPSALRSGHRGEVSRGDTETHESSAPVMEGRPSRSALPRADTSDPELATIEAIRTWLRRVNVDPNVSTQVEREGPAQQVEQDPTRTVNCGQQPLPYFTESGIPSFQAAGLDTIPVPDMPAATNLDQFHTQPERIAQTLTLQGPGAHTVFAVLRGGDGKSLKSATTAHFYVAHNDNGQIYSLNGQSGQAVPWSDFTKSKESDRHWVVSVPRDWNSVLPPTATDTANYAARSEPFLDARVTAATSLPISSRGCAATSLLDTSSWLTRPPRPRCVRRRCRIGSHTTSRRGGGTCARTSR